MPKDTVTKESFERYLAQATSLDADTKTSLRAEFTLSDGAKSVYDKAVRLSGRKAMTKVPAITSKK